MSEPSLFGSAVKEPLAARMRPRSIDQVLGQEELLGDGAPLRRAIESGDIGSMILWGPPGCGKTTLARLMARHVRAYFEPFSAVTEGVPRVREIIARAQNRRSGEGRGTVLFCDEIHRFNKAQQDAFLPWVEDGTIVLVGATTENPSFELNSALLSRVDVHVLHPLDDEALGQLIERAMTDDEASPLLSSARFDETVRRALIHTAQGDARRLLNALEAIERHLANGGVSEITVEILEQITSRPVPRYDKSGEQHYNLISALHKSIRGSDVEATLYWLARMLTAGEDPLYLARRMERMATEDIGLADPAALQIVVAARESFHMLGSPEGELALAQAAVYLATAPKSNAVYSAWKQATAAARDHSAEEVPLHIRNAPTGLMKEIGYGAGYRYDPAEDEGFAAGQEYLPDALRGSRWYEPREIGFERKIAERLEWWAERRAKGGSRNDS